MTDSTRIAVLVGIVLFLALIFIPVASFLIRAALIAGLVAVGVYIVLRLTGRR